MAANDGRMERMNPTRLAGCGPRESAAYLGPALAAWLLSPAARADAKIAAPRLPQRPGVCAGILIWCQRPCPACGPGFVLPLEWRKGVPHSSTLPGQLAEQAQQALDVMKVTGWGLGVAEELGPVDLSAFSVDAPSVWAPLAAGLVLAIEGGVPQRNVFATGRWTGDFIGGVGDIEQKIEVLRGLEGQPALQLFVPAANYEQALAARPAKIEVRSYPAHSGEKPRKLLAAHLLALDVPPNLAENGYESCQAYAMRPYVTADRNRWREYYLENLVAPLAERISQQSEVPPPGGSLVLALSLSYDLACLLVRVMRPQRALLLVTEKSNDYLPLVEQAFPGCQVAPPLLISDDMDELVIVGTCADWLRQEPRPEARFTDVTGGWKTTTSVLIAAGQQTGAGIYYVQHQLSVGQTPVIGSEILRRLRWLETDRDRGADQRLSEPAAPSGS